MANILFYTFRRLSLSFHLYQIGRRTEIHSPSCHNWGAATDEQMAPTSLLACSPVATTNVGGRPVTFYVQGRRGGVLDHQRAKAPTHSGKADKKLSVLALQFPDGLTH